MKTSEANIKLVKRDNKISSLSVIMPMWQKAEDEAVIVNIPLFNIKTFARNEEGAIVAIEESLKCFCISAENFGKGVEIELQLLGWQIVSEDDNETLLNFSLQSDSVVLEQIYPTVDFDFLDKELSLQVFLKKVPQAKKYSSLIKVNLKDGQANYDLSKLPNQEEAEQFLQKFLAH